jgi:ribosomal protein L7/L12
MSDLAPNDEQWKQIKDALRVGNKIEAIKIYRDAVKCQLVDAKQAIDKLSDELHAADPATYPKAKGCFGMILLATALIYFVS